MFFFPKDGKVRKNSCHGDCVLYGFLPLIMKLPVVRYSPVGAVLETYAHTQSHTHHLENAATIATTHTDLMWTTL